MTRAEIFERLQHAEEKLAERKMQIARAKSDLYSRNKPTNPTIFSKWLKEEADLKRLCQRLQFEMGEAKRREN
jgi:hypothetical protein